MIFSKIVREKMSRLNLSTRDLAKEVNISHTTINRITRNKPVDLETFNKLSNWLGMEPEAAIEAVLTDDLPSRITLMVLGKPRLAAEIYKFCDAVQSGEIPEDEIQDVLNYAQYKLALKSQV